MTAPWQADFSRRLRIRNRLEELNAKLGPLEDEPMPDWLDHYPTPEERRAMDSPPATPPPPPTESRRKPAETRPESLWGRESW